ncbi:MAG: hypothetical protein K0R08_84 [Solimicrobium sp.]|jgi:type VI secretion system protein ImpH|nr:hypothetical protein [Solimicrobium sp.]
MAAETRNTTGTVKERLLANSEAFSYFQAMRLLDLFGQEQGLSPGNLRIRPKLALGFPDSDIDRIIQRPDGSYQVTANFFGLYGVSSPLPTYYTEELFEEERENRHATRDFLDIFHHAMYPMLFGAWTKYRLQLRVVEKNHINVLNNLYAFIGLNNPVFRSSVSGSEELLRYTGLLNQRPRSALGLHTMLADAFSPAKIEIQSCLKKTHAISTEQRLRLGEQAHCLGENAYLGSQVDDYANNIAIQIYDVPDKLFHDLLPGKNGYERLKLLTRYYLIDPLTVNVEVSLAQGSVQNARLNSASWSQLGLDTWLKADENTQVSRVGFSI